MRVSGHLSEVFQIFTKGEKLNALPRLLLSSNVTAETLSLATDGSCTNNRDADAVAGAGVFYSENNPLNMSIRVPPDLSQTNQTGEILALKKVVERAPMNMNLDIELNSMYVIDMVTKRLQKNEDSGYITTTNADLA